MLTQIFAVRAFDVLATDVSDLGTQMSPRLEAFCPAELAGHPVFMVFPGGGYHHHASHEGHDVAMWLNSCGLNAVVLHYTVSPDGNTAPIHPAPLLEARTVLAWLRAGKSGLEVDSARIGVIGFSAGGHLAALLSTVTDADPGPESGRPDLSVLAYPVISMLPTWNPSSTEHLAGTNATLDLRRSLSAELRVDAAVPPTFLWHTSDDEGVPVGNSLAYAASLAEHGVPFELQIFPHGRHGLGLAAGVSGVEKWPARCEEWLGRLGWLQKAG